MSEPAVLYEKRDGIAVVTMNRPEVRNAINTEMLCRLADAWQDVNDDPDVRVAVLTGAGDKAFCAGADLDKLVRMMQGLRPPETEFDERVRNDLSIIYKGLLRNYRVWKPLVAAVRGFCVAGGTEILTCTDIRIAGDDARFGLAEVKWSLFPMGGSTVRLPRQIPYCNAMEILLTGEQLSARARAPDGADQQGRAAGRGDAGGDALRTHPVRGGSARGAGGEALGASRA